MSVKQAKVIESRRDAGLAGKYAPDRKQIADIQRSRLLAAMVDVAVERGAAGASVAHVVARSRVSRRTFYELFDGSEDCFLAAFEDGVGRISDAVLRAYGQPGRWREKIRRALAVLLELMDREPVLSRFLIVEALRGGTKVLERREQVLASVNMVIDLGREGGDSEIGSPALTAEGIVGGVLSLIHARLVRSDMRSLAELLNQLMAMIVLPYLGTAAARRELRQPVAQALDGRRRAIQDPLRDLEMRLTYRTMRVLLAIGACPGASNRQVADAAGISDQGQISKLLTRLDHLGLVCNTSNVRAKGEPNAWMLTDRGADLQERIAV